MPSYRVLACNTIVFNSQFFAGFFDPEKHDVMCAYSRRSDGKWKVSMYTTKDEIDCGAIAKHFGGGGHKGAAGFVCTRLPWGTKWL
jgi:nanoRNase/pAp phosphatase (c-di-AMP/oligoRNAs hydrolase)